MRSVQTSARDGDRVRRLRSALAAGGAVPPDLAAWVMRLAERGESASNQWPMSPTERLCVSVSDEIDRWIVARGITRRILGRSVSPRTLNRCLSAENVSLSTVADVADALDCDVEIKFRARGVSAAPDGINGTTALSPKRIASIVGAHVEER